MPNLHTVPTKPQNTVDLLLPSTPENSDFFRASVGNAKTTGNDPKDGLTFYFYFLEIEQHVKGSLWIEFFLLSSVARVVCSMFCRMSVMWVLIKDAKKIC
ncbi:hypothetical protein CEXT_479571 [Caerostris extrusa]|uniref:Uncharacterized protein n=1 Tax=Caerostris extrusa TaxID=172846 RepID=A0AAV4MLR4_CAEEX|nr:hypothetical protein CEXT_479571 [Caerostris extrusa]